MIDSSIERLFDSINNSKEYQEYLNITSILGKNKKVKDLIEEIKSLQKEAVKLENEGNTKYKEIDKEIEEKSKILNEDKDYQEYLSKLKKFNNTLIASSSLIEDYIDSKVSV